jgi:hypothetical protein
MPETGTPTFHDTADAHVGNASFALGMAESIAEGHYGAAMQSAAMRVAFTPKVYEAAAEVTKAVEPVASALGWVGRNLPVIGGVVLAAYDAKEVYDHIKKGDYKGAAVAGIAGVAEVAGTVALGGIGGAAAREAVWGVNHLAGGPDINHSGLVSVGIGAVKLAERGVQAASKYMGGPQDPAKIAQQQNELLHRDNILPKTVKLEGKEVGLDVALRNPAFNQSFRQNLLDAQKHGHLDAKPLIADLDRFDALEKERTAATASGKAAPAATASAAARPAAPAHA